MTRLVTVHCQNCDHYFQVQLQRQNKKGEGASYARDMTKLSPQHQLILDVMKWNGAFDDLKGMTWNDIKYECLDVAKARRDRIPDFKGLSGRLSELAGTQPPQIESTEIEIELQDRETMKFRAKKKTVYWLRREAPKMEVKLDENPMLGDMVKGVFAI